MRHFSQLRQHEQGLVGALLAQVIVNDQEYSQDYFRFEAWFFK